MSETLLQVSELGVALRTGGSLVSGVSFELGPGERLGIVGESGSGKSVTALAMLGLLPDAMRASGSVRYRGTEIVGQPERLLNDVRGRGLTAVFQEPLSALDPLMPIGRQLMAPFAKHRGLGGSALRTAVLDALEQVRLPTPERIARSRTFEISGGQRQRVAIALALACDPDIVVLDEPTTALDVTVQAEILGLLRRLATERTMAMVFISHDLPVVASLADRVLVMHGGEVVESGTMDAVIQNPVSAHAAELVAAARRLEVRR